MKVAFLDSRDLWYAKVLLPVFEYENCKEIVRIQGKRGAWRINGERIIIAKKGKTRGKRTRYWQFTFNPNELVFCAEEGRRAKICLLLVCGEAVCALSWREAQEVMRPGHITGYEPLYVKTKNKQWYNVTGAKKDADPLLAEKTNRLSLLKYVYYS